MHKVPQGTERLIYDPASKCMAVGLTDAMGTEHRLGEAPPQLTYC